MHYWPMPVPAGSVRVVRAAAVGAVLVATACGTRLPDKDFTANAQEQVVTGPGGVTASAAPGGVVPTSGSTLPVGGPSAVSTAGAGQGGGGGATGAPGNTASDVGVTTDSITIGTIASKTNPF